VKSKYTLKEGEKR